MGYTPGQTGKGEKSLAIQALDFRVLSRTDISKEVKSGVVEPKEITLLSEILAQYVGSY
jgi:hypothetical protein